MFVLSVIYSFVVLRHAAGDMIQLPINTNRLTFAIIPDFFCLVENYNF